jgi:hypothetical protein
MRKYAIIGSLLILGMALAGRAVSLAQKTPLLAVKGPDEEAPPLAEVTKQKEILPNIPIVDEPSREAYGPATKNDSRPQLSSYQPVPAIPSAEAVDKLPVLELPPSTTKPAALVLASGNDPMGTIETFLVRNRKEAEQAIETLNQEAEALRARLQKVEAALSRWQEVEKALCAEPQTALIGKKVEPVLMPDPMDESAGQKMPAPSRPEKRWAKPESETAPNPVVEGEQPTTLEPIPTVPAQAPQPTELPPAPAETKPTEPPQTLPEPVPTKPTEPTPASLPPPTLPPPGDVKPPEKPPEPAPEAFPALPEAKVPSVPPTSPDLPIPPK